MSMTAFNQIKTYIYVFNFDKINLIISVGCKKKHYKNGLIEKIINQ